MNFNRRSLTRTPSVLDDPLSAAIQPPSEESPEARRARLEELQEAQRISRQIDADLAETKKVLDKRKRAIKILLLGQAESGKSTTLKNFQLAFSPNHFRNERLAWRTVIQLNLIRHVKLILDVLEDERAQTPQSPGSSRKSNNPYKVVRLRLSPLLTLESALSAKFAPGEEKAVDADNPERSIQEVYVRAGSGWKTTLAEATSIGAPSASTTKGSDSGSGNGNVTARTSTGGTVGDSDPTGLLVACKDDIMQLWMDRKVRDVLKKHEVRLEDMGGFFLNDTPRIATSHYEPTDEDILRARLRTLGVEEHHFTLESGSAAGTEWYIYDVGGSRGQRPHWVPFFDDVQAIIFLAPLAFNLTLEEDPKINRLADSISIWKLICGNTLLANASLILFLNKMDILQATLAAGVRVKDYVPSYGDCPNDLANVTKYFKTKFRAYQKKLSPKARLFYCHETSVTDNRATYQIITGVQDSILRQHLKSANVV